jgi:hypothetical protein
MENCKGKNCAIAGENMHSLECMFEHFISYTGEDIDADNALIAKLRKAYFDGAATTESELEALKRERAVLIEALTLAEHIFEVDDGIADTHERCIIRSALSATEQQSQQWLAGHDAGVLVKFKKEYRLTEPRFLSEFLDEAINRYRLAASKRKEQV